MNNATMPAVNGENVCENVIAKPKSLIPVEEQALENENRIPLFVYNPLAELLKDEDLEVEAEDIVSKEYAEAERRGFFSPLIGMARLLSTAGEFYAQISIDTKENRRIVFCQKYENGKISPKIQLRQSDFFRAIKYEYGAIKSADKRENKAVSDFKFKLENECLNKFDSKMSFDVVDVLQAIESCYWDLPVHRDAVEEESPIELYQSIMEILGQNSYYDDDSGILYGHDGYYPFTSKDIKWIADSLGMRKDELLKKLKK